MTASDCIALFSAITALLIGIISISISVFTLRQNSKMIEGQTRAYISVYGEITFFQSAKYYIVIKNFGASSALIEQFKITPPIQVMADEHTPFQNLAGVSVAPGQSFRCPINVQKFNQGVFNFRIVYSSNGKRYSEESTLRPSAHFDQSMERASTDGKELKIISYTLQDLVEKQL